MKINGCKTCLGKEKNGHWYIGNIVFQLVSIGVTTTQLSESFNSCLRGSLPLMCLSFLGTLIGCWKT